MILDHVAGTFFEQSRPIMKTIVILVGLVAGTLAAQTTPPPFPAKLYVYYLVPGANVWLWRPLTLDPASFTLAVDAAGQATLKANIPPPPKIAREVEYVYIVKDTDQAPLSFLVPQQPVSDAAVDIYVGGIRQSAGWQFTFDATAKTITFKDGFSPTAQEVVTVRYRTAN